MWAIGDLLVRLLLAGVWVSGGAFLLALAMQPSACRERNTTQTDTMMS